MPGGSASAADSARNQWVKCSAHSRHSETPADPQPGHHVGRRSWRMHVNVPAAGPVRGGTALVVWTAPTPVDGGGTALAREGDRDRVALLAHPRSEEHTSELQSRGHLVCRL